MAVTPPNLDGAVARLTAAGVVHTVREGAVRLSPHAYSTADEVDQALALLEG